MTQVKKTGLELLRDPFPAHHISKLPKPTKKQTDEVSADYKAGHRCTICGGWHHKDVIHLDYVGHAALTDRLLDADINWSWEPFALGADGLPAFDKIGGLWIKLTVCGRTMPGYGSPDGKTGGNAIKEAIGDALRNGSMRLGAALDLWHKGDLHLEPEKIQEPEETYFDLCERLSENIAEIKIGIQKQDLKRASCAWASLSEEEKMSIWKAPSNGGCFTTDERTVMKSKEFREANI